MYGAYFGLKENPFNLTPDQRYLFLSRYHQEALDHLLYGINDRKGFIAIAGGIGTGKTTLCRALLSHLDASTKTALIFNTSISDTELLETINQEFGLELGGTKRDQIDRLNRFLLENFRRGGNAVLIVDEAQNLSPLVLEQIRMLSNLETEREKLIQIALVGQPQLRRLLRAPALRQVNERVTVWYQLQPLDRQDVQNYVEHRLVVAGSRGNVRFTRSALRAVYAYSRGIPRRINAVCDRALLIAYCKDEFAIGRSTILKAVDDIQGDFRRYFAGPAWLKSRVVPAGAVMLVAFLAASLTGWNLREQASDLFSALEKVAVVQSKAFTRSPLPVEETPFVPRVTLVRKPIEAPEETVSLTLDDRASLGGLFRLFDVEEVEQGSVSGDIYPGLFSFEGDPELYRAFRKPFRLRITSEDADDASHLLIREVTTGGAVALDAEGNQRPVTEDYILGHWDGEMSWVYPHEHGHGALAEGMSGLRVLKIQQMLQELGYAVEPRGVFDSRTFDEVMRFQLNFGLEAHGMVDVPTKALLYQMTG